MRINIFNEDPDYISNFALTNGFAELENYSNFHFW